MRPLAFTLIVLFVAEVANGQPRTGAANPDPPTQATSRVAWRSPQPRVRYELGPDSLAQDSVPKGKLEGPFLFRSKIIANTVRKYWVFVPAQYKAADDACVLVLQDGARAVNPNGVLRVPQVLENLIAKNQIPTTIGIFITPGQLGDEFPDSIGTGNPNNRADEYDALSDAYARMVIQEILPLVGETYNLRKDAASRAIGGASSGGICAFTVAWERPQEFRNVVSLIGSFTDIRGGHVYPQLVQETERKPIRVFLQDGVNDNRSSNPNRDWHLQNQKMVAALQEKNYDMAHVFGQGGHSDDHGGAILPQMLRWIWRDYPGITPPETDLVAEAGGVRPAVIELFPGFDKEAKIDPTGWWTWERRFGGSQSVSKLRLGFENGRLEGTFAVESDQNSSEPTPIESAEIIGNKVVFDVAREFNGRPFKTTYQGIVHGDELVGRQMIEFNGAPRDFAWKANRQK